MFWSGSSLFALLGFPGQQWVCEKVKKSNYDIHKVSLEMLKQLIRLLDIENDITNGNKFVYLLKM